jgi:hypothetical protein
LTGTLTFFNNHVSPCFLYSRVLVAWAQFMIISCRSVATEIRSRHPTFPTSLDIHYLQVNIIKECGMINAPSDHTAIANRYVSAFICPYRSHVLTCSFTVVCAPPCWSLRTSSKERHVWT